MRPDTICVYRLKATYALANCAKCAPLVAVRTRAASRVDATAHPVEQPAPTGYGERGGGVFGVSCLVTPGPRLLLARRLAVDASAAVSPLFGCSSSFVRSFAHADLPFADVP